MHPGHDGCKTHGISVTKEKTNVYSDTQTFDAFVHQWVYFAERYKQIDSKILSFNLVNEPIALPNAAELAALEKKGPVTTADLFSPEMLNKHAADYIRLARACGDAIRAHDPKRLVVTDGYPAGSSPIPSLTDTGMLQSCHTYTPTPLTHISVRMGSRNSDRL